MNSENTVLFSVEAGVARITLNRPVSRNAMDLELARRLHRVLEDAAGDDQVQVLLLAGNGRLFCSGGDLRSIAATQDRGALLRELVSSAHGAVRVLAGLDKPVVAAVQGSAAGAGLSLALVSDVVLAAPRTSFITAYTAVGLTPDCGQSWLLPRVVGLGRALDLTLNPVKVSSEAARAMGIVKPYRAGGIAAAAGPPSCNPARIRACVGTRPSPGSAQVWLRRRLRCASESRGRNNRPDGSHNSDRGLDRLFRCRGAVSRVREIQENHRRMLQCVTQ